MRNFNRNRSVKKFYTINQHITASQLRVIDSEGKQIGLLTRQQAIDEAQHRELDLILISPHSNPPVAKIIDFKKFLYQEQKKQKEAKKGVRRSTVKDIKFSLFIAEADFQRLVEKAKEFLKEGNQVRLNLTLKGREMGKKDMAINRTNQFIGLLGEVNVSKEPRAEGRVIRAVVTRKK